MAETRTMILSTAPEAAMADHVDLRRDVLNGCPWHDVKSMLRDVGLRPTRQRMALGWILFAKGDRHLTAEMLYEEATKAKVPVSLATVYNTLHQFTGRPAPSGRGLTRRLFRHQHHRASPSSSGDNALVDIPGADDMVSNMPRLRRTESPASTWWSACVEGQIIKTSFQGRIVSRSGRLSPAI
jgi:Fur family iron response transcriptional regulator